MDSPKLRYACSQCPKKFPSKKLLKMHLTVKEHYEFICDLCKEVFLSQQQLDNHTNEDDDLEYEKDRRIFKVCKPRNAPDPLVMIDPRNPVPVFINPENTSERYRIVQHECEECGAVFCTRKKYGDHVYYGRCLKQRLAGSRKKKKKGMAVVSTGVTMMRDPPDFERNVKPDASFFGNSKEVSERQSPETEDEEEAVVVENKPGLSASVQAELDKDYMEFVNEARQNRAIHKPADLEDNHFEMLLLLKEEGYFEQ